ncbi:2-oxoacid:ferredoxin oxidoreductase subunit gamma [candidate division KSB3 bacterium]|uniref:2-oxoacid:ferredoxin oxidoreductase subunit gamma n=1 Tax=candidate division KSB3 bacterium TaxID=2044937 RepID=A0A2G6KC66_9BACT|nr:MAG: 2-oxoacid:ferredoxin oxidoreductase subunit gamma [candidate division KSB3 bacterium]
MNERIIISGFGGQGVMTIGKLLASAGMMEQRHVSWLPSYGPEMRGGTANCHVIISDEQIGAPVVTEASCVVAMNLPSLEKFEHVLKAGALLLLNSSLIDKQPVREDIQAISVPVNDIANRQGNLKVANLVMLGAYLACSHAVQESIILQALDNLLGSKKRHLLDINISALHEGMKFVASAETALSSCS